MAILNVNATRMELTNLKRKLNTARRGHKLLKDKRDELMRRFLDTVKENLALRLKVEEGIKSANNYMAIAGSVMQPQVLSTALMLPKQEVRIDVSEKNVMSVMIPEFKTEFKSKNSEDIYSYGYAFTSGELDGAVSAISSVFTDMIKLAEIEYYYKESGEKPVLLLDDVLSELDEKRRTALLEATAGTQTILTCTEFTENVTDYNKIEISKGAVVNQ